DNRLQILIRDRLDHVPILVQHLNVAAAIARALLSIISARFSGRSRRTKPGKRLQLRKLPSRLSVAIADCVTVGPGWFVCSYRYRDFSDYALHKC
ncbi:MAG: hypothetical protein DME86_12690, partial [Verrucomicrobia bacterium]